jgi:hypothetical protein
LATALVSIAPVFILPMIPIDHTPERQPLLKGTHPIVVRVRVRVRVRCNC